MKSIIAIIAAIFLTACGTTGSGSTSGGGESGSYKVRVQATGSNQEQARTNAFRKAIELAVGTIVLGEAVVRNDRLIRNEIISYSSGYIDNFTIISSTPTSVEMDVWVSESRIAKRLINMGVSSTDMVNGRAIRQDWDRREAQEVTAERRRSDSIKLMHTVLNDYPRAAYQSKVIGTKMTREGGTPVLVTKVEIKFNSVYTDTLEDVAKKARDFSRGPNDRNDRALRIWNNLHYTTAWWVDGSVSHWKHTFDKPVWVELNFGDKRFCWQVDDSLRERFFRLGKTYIANNSTVYGEYDLFTKGSMTINLHITNSDMNNKQYIEWASTLQRVESRIADTDPCKM